jgi:hypothetical protein
MFASLVRQNSVEKEVSSIKPTNTKPSSPEPRAPSGRAPCGSARRWRRWRGRSPAHRPSGQRPSSGPRLGIIITTIIVVITILPSSSLSTTTTTRTTIIIITHPPRPHHLQQRLTGGDDAFSNGDGGGATVHTPAVLLQHKGVALRTRGLPLGQGPLVAHRGRHDRHTHARHVRRGRELGWEFESKADRGAQGGQGPAKRTDTYKQRSGSSHNNDCATHTIAQQQTMLALPVMEGLGFTSMRVISCDPTAVAASPSVTCTICSATSSRHSNDGRAHGGETGRQYEEKTIRVALMVSCVNTESSNP